MKAANGILIDYIIADEPATVGQSLLTADGRDSQAARGLRHNAL